MSLLTDKIKYFKPGILSLIAFWVFTLFLVDISGEFPLIDDWAYAKSVYAFSELDQFIIYDIWRHLTGQVFQSRFTIVGMSARCGVVS